MNCKKDQFLLDDQVTYLNCGYMSPQLKKVYDAGINALALKNQPNLVTAEDFFTGTEKLRIEYSKLINNTDPNRIAIVPSVSYGMSVVSHNLTLNKGDNIIVASEQFPSNIYTWQKKAAMSKSTLHMVKPPNGFDRGKIWNERILENINSKTRLVSIGNIHWADGTKFDLMELRKRTREVNALLVVDGSQSVGALPIDIKKLKPDALICVGYKWLLGPYAIGLAYFGPAFDQGSPIEENWINRHKSEQFENLVNYQPRYKPKAQKYNMGENSNFIHVPMLTTAINQLINWKPENIQEYCKKISVKMVSEFRDLGMVIEDEIYRSHHLFGIRIPASFNMEKLIRIFKQRNIFISIRGNSIRISTHVYNQESDLIKLLEAFKKAI